MCPSGAPHNAAVTVRVEAVGPKMGKEEEKEEGMKSRRKRSC